MERILCHVARCAVGVAPGNIIYVVKKTGVVLFRNPVGVGAPVSDSVIMTSFSLVVFAACKLVPLVVGKTVAVSVVAYHHYTRLGRATALVGVEEFVERIAPYSKILFSGDVDNGVVKAECHITTVASERNHNVVCARYGFLCFLKYDLVCVAFFISRHFVYKLARSRTILVYFKDIRAIFYLFVENMDSE